MLAANTKTDLFDLLELLTTLLTNVKDHSADAKYRLIKLNNKAIQSRLVGRKGGVEFLQAAGFVAKTVDGTKVLQLDGDDAGLLGSPNVAAEAEDALAWLQAQADTCIQMADVPRGPRGAADTCAECIVQVNNLSCRLTAWLVVKAAASPLTSPPPTLQLRFPTGATAVGGFARTDRVSDVLSFACCFYHADRADAVRLREGHSAKVRFI